MFDLRRDRKIFVAGHNGMVGSAVVRRLSALGFENLVTRSRNELDLTEQSAVRDFFESERPEVVVLAAARVGGIKANNEHPAEFIRDNLAIQTNVIHYAWLSGVEKLCFLGSSCIYPRECPQPIKEDALLTGPLEPTNEAYAVAKIAGCEMARHYSRQYGMRTISAMPCNLYGKNDDFNLETCHVLSALVKRYVDAADDGKDEVVLWGAGSAFREFLEVDDLAAAVVFLLEHHDDPRVINVGSGKEISVKDLAAKVAAAAKFAGKTSWDTSKPDGTPRKIMDSSRIRAMGWTPEISLDNGIQRLIDEYRERKSGA